MEKLTLISLWYRGQRFSAFVRIAPDADGKVRLSATQIATLCSGRKITPGHAWMIGG